MHKVPLVQIVLHGSRTAVAATLLLAASSFAVIVTLPIPLWAFGVSFVVLAGWAWHSIRDAGLRRGRRSISALRLNGQRVVEVETVDGVRTLGSLRDDSYVGARLTTLVWRAEGTRRSRSVLILPDMLPAEDFRRLRVLMRYARSDATEEAPASHA